MVLDAVGQDSGRPVNLSTGRAHDEYRHPIMDRRRCLRPKVTKERISSLCMYVYVKRTIRPRDSRSSADTLRADVMRKLPFVEQTE